MRCFIQYMGRLLAGSVLVVALSARAQNAHPAFKQYDVDDGLPGSKVYQVKQDAKGYIWFATNNGVSRFNGYEFENFTMSNGLPDNTVFELYEDKAGRMWFVPLSNQLSYFYKGKIYPYKYNYIIKQKLMDRAVKTSFCVDEQGTVHLGLAFYGVCSITAQGHCSVTKTAPAPGNSVVVYEPVKDHFIYTIYDLGPGKGGIAFNTKGLQGSVLLPVLSSYIHARTRIVKLKNGQVALSSDQRFFLFNKNGSYRQILFNEIIFWISEDNDGGLWIGTFTGGVYYIHNYDFDHMKHYLQGRSVTGVLQDREGGFWFTTEGDAVYYTPSKQVLTYDKEAGFDESRISCLATDGERVYAGLENNFIHSVTAGGAVIKYTKTAHKNSIANLYYDTARAQLWYSGNTSRGTISKGRHHKYADFIFYDLVPVAPGVYWANNSHGILKIVNNKKDLGYKSATMNGRVNTILRKNKTTLFAGTTNGLWEFDMASYKYTYVAKQNALLQNRVLHLAYMADSALVIATKGVGLLVYQNGNVQQFNAARGLASDNVFKLLVKDSVIWAATDKGLCQIIRHKNNMLEAVRVFKTDDGLISNEINDLVMQGQNMWLASDKGLSFFNPGALPVAAGELPVYISHVAVNDSGLAVKTNYRLKYNENNIKINFIALGYKTAKKLRYRYRMQGLDTSWVYTTNRETQYTTLPPGRYKFMVAVLNASGQWTQQPASIEFTILTPFWQAWWFLLLGICATGFAIFYCTRYFIKKAQREKHKHEQINKALLNLKLKALRAQMNPHFIFNVMNSIQQFILYKNNQAAHKYLSVFSRLIRTILNNSEKNTVPLAEEVKALELYLGLEAMRFDQRFSYSIAVDGDVDIHKTEIPSMLIQPYVENAVKHGILPSLSGGYVNISISRQARFLHCVIEDNGVGRAQAMQQHKGEEYRSFGTSITKERLLAINELYDSSLSETITDLYDDNGRALGTRVKIYIPFTLN